MNEIVNEVASKSEGYLVFYLFLLVLFLIISGLLYYLYWANRKGEIWDSDGSETGSFSWKIKRDEDPRGFRHVWWTNLLIIIGIITITVVVLFF